MISDRLLSPSLFAFDAVQWSEVFCRVIEMSNNTAQDAQFAAEFNADVDAEKIAEVYAEEIGRAHV